MSAAYVPLGRGRRGDARPSNGSSADQCWHPDCVAVTLAYGRHASGTEAEQTGGRHSPAIVAERYGRHAAYGSRGRWRVPVARRPFYVAHGGRHRFGFRSPLALVEADGSLTRIGYGPDYPPAERITERDMSEME